MRSARPCLVDLDADGTPEVLALNLPNGNGAAFKRGADGWVVAGVIQNAHCRGMRDALRAGEFTTKPPNFQDIEVKGTRLRIGSDCAPDVIFAPKAR